jgi:hypothetical protein
MCINFEFIILSKNNDSGFPRRTFEEIFFNQHWMILYVVFKILFMNKHLFTEIIIKGMSKWN